MPADGTKYVMRRDGRMLEVSREDYWRAVDQGWVPETKAQLREREARARAGDSPVLAALAGAARGLSFGTSDLALQMAGVERQTLQDLRDANPTASGVGEIGSVLGSVLMPATAVTKLGAAGKLISGPRAVSSVAAKTGAKVEGALLRTLAGEAGPSLAKQAMAKVTNYATAGAVEGAVYGAGTALSEEALGSPELVASSLFASALSGAGSGAAVGGAVGGIISPALILGAQGLRKVATKVDSVVGPKTADFSRVAQEMETLQKLGLSPSQFKTIASKKPKGWDKQTLEFLRRSDLLDDGRSLLSGSVPENIDRLRRATKSAGSTIESALDEIDQVLPKQKFTDGTAIAEDLFAAAEDSVGFSHFQPFRARLQQAAQDVTNQQQIGAKWLWKFRNSFEKPSGFTPGTAEHADNVIRKRVNQAYKEMVENVKGTDAYNRLKRADKIYHHLGDLEVATRRGATGGPQPPGWNIATSIAAGAGGTVGGGLGSFAGPVGSVVGGAVGSAIGASTARAFMGSNMSGVVSVLNTLQKTSRAASEAIDTSVNHFLSGKARKVTPATLKIWTALTGEKDEKEAVRQLGSELARMKADPALLATRLSNAVGPISEHAPAIAQAWMGQTQRAIEFASNIVPTPPVSIVPEEWEISKAEQHEVGRRLAAVFYPQSVFEMLEDRTITDDVVHALRGVHEDFYQQAVAQVLETIHGRGAQLNPGQRRALEIFLQRPLDGAQSDMHMARAQSFYADQKTTAQTQTSFKPLRQLKSDQFKSQSQRTEVLT